MKSTANIKTKLFYLHRQKDKALAGAVYHVLQGSGNQRRHQPWSQRWQRERQAIWDAGSWVRPSDQFPCCHTRSLGRAQYCVTDKRQPQIWPSSWTCEENRGLTTYTQGLHSFSGTKIPPVARSTIPMETRLNCDIFSLLFRRKLLTLTDFSLLK